MNTQEKNASRYCHIKLCYFNKNGVLNSLYVPLSHFLNFLVFYPLSSSYDRPTHPCVDVFTKCYICLHNVMGPFNI